MLGIPIRNTPTGVGKTQKEKGVEQNREKHPHGRGEDTCLIGWRQGTRETPPRAWGRRRLGFPSSLCLGNTPTGVGKTSDIDGNLLDYWKHPHGRGEDVCAPALTRKRLETPPRAWGRLSRSSGSSSALGNTPTGVGKTVSPILQS